MTGAAGGLGRTFAGRLAAEGYDLVLVDVRKEPLEAVTKMLQRNHGITASPVAADLSRPEDIARVKKHIGEIEDLVMLVNNAGFGIKDGYLATTDVEKQIGMIYVHNIASTRFTQAAIPQMIARGRGGIINVASILGFFPLPANSFYCGTKAFLINFTEALHMELYDTGVNVQVLCPGFIRTGFHDTMGVSISNGEHFPWMDPTDVVKESLDNLGSSKVVYVPGGETRRFLFKIRVLPRRLMYRIVINKAKKNR